MQHGLSALLLQSSVTWYFRDHSKMLICCSRHISYQCWKQLCSLIFIWKLFF